MSDYRHVNSAADGIALAHTIYGSPVQASRPSNSTGEGIGPATWSTAPYLGGKQFESAVQTERRCQAKADCKGAPMRREFQAENGEPLTLCVGHARGRGLLGKWGRDGRHDDAE